MASPAAGNAEDWCSILVNHDLPSNVRKADVVFDWLAVSTRRLFLDCQKTPLLCEQIAKAAITLHGDSEST